MGAGNDLINNVIKQKQNIPKEDEAWEGKEITINYTRVINKKMTSRHAL